MQRPDIISVLEGYGLTLRKAGREFLGLCPFHDDQRPSLSVNARKQVFLCRACGESGDVFTFIMKLNGLTFPEAKRVLGISIDRSPRPMLTPKRVLAAEQAAAWADQQRARLNDLIIDRIEQADLADECGDDELLEIFHRELVLFKAFHDSLDSPGGVIELLSVRAALELIAR